MKRLGQYLTIWFLLLLVSITNGALREWTYGRWMSELAAHQLSSLTSVLLLGTVMWASLRVWPLPSKKQAILVGLLWLLMTVAFEFLFFHFIGGHSWAVLWANYNLFQGRLWVVVLVWVAVAPSVFFRLRKTNGENNPTLYRDGSQRSK